MDDLDEQELGGRVLPLKRGVSSKALLQQLRDEAAVPLWPDPEDPETVAASDAMLVCASPSMG